MHTGIDIDAAYGPRSLHRTGLFLCWLASGYGKSVIVEHAYGHPLYGHPLVFAVRPGQLGGKVK